MPRKFTHKLGTAHRRDYPEQRMEDALSAVILEQKSFSQAAEEFGVPKTTLFNKYRGLHGDKMGRKPAIPAIEEKKIVSALLTAAEFRVPFSEIDLMNFVQQYLNRKGDRVPCFNDNRPGKDWVTNFLERNPELSRRNSQNIKRNRAELKPEVISEYFDGTNH